MSEQSGNKQDMSVNDTPMALLEQLVYMENFFQDDTSPNATANTPDNITNAFNDQLQRELAAFADDTFIFPDEEKALTNEGSSHDPLDNSNRFASSNRGNDLLSFAEATSFNHVSPSLSTSKDSTTQAQSYQNLTQRYTNKKKYDYHDMLQNNDNVMGSTNINTSTLSNSGNTNGNFSDLNKSPIPSTIHELLRKKPLAPSSSFNQPNLSRNHIQDIQPTNIRNQAQAQSQTQSQSQSQSQSQTQSQQFSNSQQQESQFNKVHIPQGAQNTLSAAGLSQTQIEALASLVAFHKPDIYNNNQQIIGGLGANPAIYQSQSLLAQSGRNNSGTTTITAAATPLGSTSGGLPPVGNQSVQQLSQQQQQQQQQQQPQNNNSLLVNLLAQTLANAVQPQQNGLLNDLVAALTKNNNSNNNPLANQLQGALSPSNLPLDALGSLQRPVEPIQHSQQPYSSSYIQTTPSTFETPTMHHSFTSPSSTGSKTRKKKEKSESPVVKSENSSEKALDSEEEKRQKVTAASARFRQKKKMKEQEMERSLQEARELSKTLESKIQQLEMENRLLRNLVVEKSQRRDDEEVERLRKKARIEAHGKEKV